jgi:hypothetical protein
MNVRRVSFLALLILALAVTAAAQLTPPHARGFDPEKDLIKATVRKENLVESEAHGRTLYRSELPETVGTAGETAVEVVTLPVEPNVETVITAYPAGPNMGGTVLGIAGFVGPLLNIATYSHIFEKKYGRAPSFPETAHYLTTGDTRSAEQVSQDMLLHPPTY